MKKNHITCQCMHTRFTKYCLAIRLHALIKSNQKFSNLSAPHLHMYGKSVQNRRKLKAWKTTTANTSCSSVWDALQYCLDCSLALFLVCSSIVGVDPLLPVCVSTFFCLHLLIKNTTNVNVDVVLPV